MSKCFCLMRAHSPTLTNIINLFLEKKVATPYILNVKCVFHGKKLLPVQKSTKCLKSHCNRFHSLISSEFKKCLTDGTKTSRKRPYHQIDKEVIIASTGCSKKNKVSATKNTGNAFAWTSKILTVVYR